MGFFDRIKNVWSGSVSASLSRMENANPEAVYASAIEEREKSYRDLRQATAGLAHLRDKLKGELERAERDLTGVLPAIEAALQEGDDDTALVLVSQKETLEQRIPALQAEIAGLEVKVSDAAEGLRNFKSELERLRREKEEMIARKNTAEARISVQESLTGLSEDADVKALANVRGHIEQLHAAAGEGYLDEQGNSIRGQVEKARARASNASAKAQLEEMKRQMKGRSGEEPVQKTLDPAQPATQEAPADAPEPDNKPIRTL